MSSLDTLVSLISSSVAEYSNLLKDAQLPLPDLNSPSPPLTRTALPEQSRLRAARAVKVVEAACAQLVATIADPGNVILTKSTAYEESACLQVALDNKIADILLDKPNGVPISTLSAETKIDEDKLSRILRLLATNHVFTEVRPNTFANNRLSIELASSNNVGPVVDIVTGEQLKAAGFLNDYLKDPEEKLPFNQLYGKSLMEYFTDPENMHRRVIWGKGIASWIDPSGQDAMHKSFPWKERLSATRTTTICDIGAGNGHVTLDLLKEFRSSSIQAIVQDLPPVLEMAQGFWKENCPEGIEKKVKFVPINFFEESPVEGADYYYIRFCLHNWSDELVIKIVSNIAKAMKKTGPHCRLLIHDITLDHPVNDPDAPPRYDEAPSPLLPNFGASRFREYASDINMLVLLNAKERSVKQMMTLWEQAGLVYERLFPSGDASIIELKLKADA
ncbi:S-adenosyl-L-methionine-dependent methyltransferase [Cristinia sonorae]|uniref:S-adenosyl-L-methionine-dependent methyltransferase n=1 Tax=Cristinia sonorae TaxID=1940300 RepID=A0A8K0UQX6_9AGAR|nr:S-adenosyl-L-methionine-dependent methyltransferase [Cristinia sonorae]